MPQVYVLPNVVNLPADKVRVAACEYLSSVRLFSGTAEEMEDNRHWAQMFIRHLPVSGIVHLSPETTNRLGI